MAVTSVLLINGAAEMGSKSQRTNAHGDFQFYQFTKDCTLYLDHRLLEHFAWLSAAVNEKGWMSQKGNTSDKYLMSDS
jgi:hypothetical protein